MKLGDILQVVAGPNASRIKSMYTEEQMYTVSNLEDDLAQIEYDVPAVDSVQAELLTSENDLVVSMIRQEAAIVTRVNVGKVLNSNFVKCEFKRKQVDPWFICYWLNESDDVKKQNHNRDMLKSYTAATLMDLSIALPEIARQREIGKGYKALKHMQYLFDRQKDEWTSLALEMMRQVMKEGK